MRATVLVATLRRLACAALVGYWMLTIAGCGSPPGNGGNADANVNDNSDDNENDNVAGEPLAAFTTELFDGSGRCAVCHTNLTDSGGDDVSIDTDWRATMMANAATDPLWQASVSAEVARHPALREVIQAICANCHMPMAHVQATAGGDPVTLLDDGFLSPDHPLHEAAMDGVSCTLCHQIADQNLGEPESFSGGYTIDTTTDRPDRAIYGPFDLPVQQAMQASVGYTPVQADHIERSDLCATCHTLFTPFVNAEGTVIGQFPEQTPFFEWRHSAFGDGTDDDQACQDCHMPAAGGPAAIASVPPGLTARAPFSRHHFVGGNVLMLRILRDNIESLGLTASTADFAATIERVVAQLTSRTASLSITSTQRVDDQLQIGLRVENLAGHKLPTGFPSRRAWFHLTVTDAAGLTVFESGAPRPDGGITGNDADLAADAFEPHYDVISSADQVQIYESIMHDSEAGVTYTLLRGAGYVKDNRLLPLGFDKASAGDDFAVWGGAAEDDDFIGGSDEIEYRIPAAGFAGPFSVTAELLFQSVSFRFVADLREDPGEPTNRFGQMYDDADKTPTALARIGLSVL